MFGEKNDLGVGPEVNNESDVDFLVRFKAHYNCILH